MRAEWRGTEQLRRHYERAQMILRGGGNGTSSNRLAIWNGRWSCWPETMRIWPRILSRRSLFARRLPRSWNGKLRRPPLPQAEYRSGTNASKPGFSNWRGWMRKLHRTLPEILALREEIQDNLSFLDACTLDIRQVEKREKQLQEQLAGVLALLNPERRKAGESFTRKLESELQGLGFSQYVRVSADWSEVALFPGCVEDRVRLYDGPLTPANSRSLWIRSPQAANCPDSCSRSFPCRSTMKKPRSFLTKWMPVSAGSPSTRLRNGSKLLPNAARCF